LKYTAGYAINLPGAITLGGVYGGGRTSPISLQDHEICCSGQ